MASIKQDPKTKTWTFVFSHYVEGQRKQVRRRGFQTKREANAAMIKLQNEMENGEYVDTSHHTVATFMAYWFENIYKLEVEALTHKNCSYLLKNHIVPGVGHIKLQKFNSIDAQDFVTNMHSEGYSRGTIKLTCNILKCALDQAEKFKLISENPVRGVKLPKKQKSVGKVWDLSQINEFLNYTKDKRHYCSYALGLLAGMRQGEILGLRFKDIDFENKLITIRQTLDNPGKQIKQGGKTASSERVISIPNQLVEILIKQKEIKQAHREKLIKKLSKQEISEMDNMDLVIFNLKHGRQVLPRKLYEAFIKDVSRAGLPRIRFHDLRHTHATLLLTMNTNVKVVSERLGHSSVGITLDTYSHVLRSVANEVAENLEQIVELGDREEIESGL